MLCDTLVSRWASGSSEALLTVRRSYGQDMAELKITKADDLRVLHTHCMVLRSCLLCINVLAWFFSVLRNELFELNSLDYIRPMRFSHWFSTPPSSQLRREATYLAIQTSVPAILPSCPTVSNPHTISSDTNAVTSRCTINWSSHNFRLYLDPRI